MKFKILLFALLFFITFQLFAQINDFTTKSKIDSLITLSRSQTSKNDFQNSVKNIEAAEDLAKEFTGTESLIYASCLFNHGRVFQFMNEYLKAEKFYLEAKSLRKKLSGDKTLEYSQSLNNLGNLYLDMGKLVDAENCHLEAKSIRENLFGKNNPDYIASLNGLGNAYASLSKYELAEASYLEAITYWKNTNSKSGPYLKGILNMGTLYKDMGLYEKSKKYYLETIELLEKNNAKISPDFALAVNNLGTLYMAMDQYKDVESLFIDSKNIREKIYGKNDPAYASNLYNLASYYQEIGNDKLAILNLLETKEIYEKTIGKNNLDYANVIENIGISYYNIDSNNLAKNYLLSALSILDDFKVQSEFPKARYLNNLSNYYSKVKEYEKIKPLLIKVKAIIDKYKNRDEYLVYLNNLGTYYYKLMMYDSAQFYYKLVRNQSKNPLTQNTITFLRATTNLAISFIKTGNVDSAYQYILEVQNLIQKKYEKNTIFFSENELSLYSKLFKKDMDLLFYFTSTNPILREKLASLCYNRAIMTKESILFEAAEINKLLNNDTMYFNKLEYLNAYKSRLIKEYNKPDFENKEAINQLEEKIQILENELARNISVNKETKINPRWSDIEKKLNTNELAIEFLQYRNPEVNEQNNDTTFYAAIILSKDWNEPKFIPLFNNFQIYNITYNSTKREDIKNIYKKEVISKTTEQKSLFNLIWKPLTPYLKNITTIYYSPVGLLNKINFSAIYFSNDSILSDRYHLVRLGNTKQILESDLKNINNTNATLFGGIIYNIGPLDSIKTNQSIDSKFNPNYSFQYSDTTLRGGTWNFLPGTEKEINEIAIILKKDKRQVNILKAAGGSEENFKLLGVKNNSQQIIHVATHAFFIQEPTFIDTKNELMEIKEPYFKRSKNPLMRSGLILANGNWTWKNQNLENNTKEDGILTSYEISQLNLNHTELVVLSACETGLGEIIGNEGVYGLQRAFKIAGVKYLIMSLWQVPDKQTTQLMTSFYNHWINEKMSIHDAFNLAQKDLRRKGLDPFYWAGFVLVE